MYQLVVAWASFAITRDLQDTVVDASHNQIPCGQYHNVHSGSVSLQPATDTRYERCPARIIGSSN